MVIKSPYPYINGLVQERHNSTANALELRLSCTSPLIHCMTLGLKGVKNNLMDFFSLPQCWVPCCMSWWSQQMHLPFNTYWGFNKMAAILQAAFFKCFILEKKLHYKYFTEPYHLWLNWWVIIWSGNDLILRKAINWTNDDPFYWCIYASLGLNELSQGSTLWRNIHAIMIKFYEVSVCIPVP